MSLVLFDLDNTLLVGDSDYEWNNFLIEQGLLDPVVFRNVNEEFLSSYEDGSLDMESFCREIFEALSVYSIATLESCRRTFIKKCIRDKIALGAPALIDHHRACGDELVMVTATNNFVVRPIAELLGIDTILATQPHIKDEHFTGALMGPACFREGKIWHVERYLRQLGKNLHMVRRDALFYSDSHNDIPLMQWVSSPVAVDPDNILLAHATQNNWPVISLRAPPTG